MTFTTITTAGAGTMGSQVAWQMAFHGKRVTVYDAIPSGLEKGKSFHHAYAQHFIAQRGATRRQIDATFARLTYTTDLAEAVRDADLIYKILCAASRSGARCGQMAVSSCD